MAALAHAVHDSDKSAEPVSQAWAQDTRFFIFGGAPEPAPARLAAVLARIAGFTVREIEADWAAHTAAGVTGLMVMLCVAAGP